MRRYHGSYHTTNATFQKGGRTFLKKIIYIYIYIESIKHCTTTHYKALKTKHTITIL